MVALDADLPRRSLHPLHAILLSFPFPLFLGTLASDIARYVLTSAALSYFAVFASEAGLFVIAAVMAVWVHRAPTKDATQQQVFNLPIATVTEGARS